MLETLYVKNLALIDEIEVEFQQGLNILTGETGAGKSILLGSVQLALGGKYNAEMLRTGAKFGVVELTFSVEKPELEEKLAELDIFPEDGRIVLSRKLMEGRSVSRINGETVAMSVLKDVAGMLIDIHGQQETQTLIHKKNHLAFLDLYAGDTVNQYKQETAKSYHAYRLCKQQLKEAVLDERQRQKEISLTEYEIKEIEEAALLENEDEETEQQYRRMLGGKQAAQALSGTYRYTGGDASGNASDFLSRAIHILSDVCEVDERGAALYEQLIEIDSLLNDFNRELAEYEKSFDFSEEDFYEVEGRLNEINHLKSKYGNSVKEILAYCEEKKQRLTELEDYETYIKKLEKEEKEAEDNYRKKAGILSDLRKKAAEGFVREIKQGLSELNFLDVQFEIRFTETSSYTALGTDEAEFYLSTNPGEAPRPMATVASGGELSRVMLAIKTVLADKEETPSLIFDEIDAGISGITAGKVAEKLHTIGQSRQVLCITHLAQIAAMADAHYLIQKQTKNSETKTEILCLEEQTSIEELARLLGGANVSGHILESAKEMKNQKMERYGSK